MKTTRRSCMKAGLVGAGLFAGTGLRGVLGQDGGFEELSFTAGKSFPINPDLPVPPDEMRMLAGYIHDYQLPAGNMNLSGGWNAVYDLLKFSAEPSYKKGSSTALMSNELLGQVAISRPSDKMEYRIRMDFRPTRAVEDVAATIRCNDDDLTSIRDYELVWNYKSGTPDSYTRREAGTVRHGALQVIFESFTDTFKLNNPLTCLWTQIDAVRRLPPDSGKIFKADMFMDLSSMRSNQQIRYSGTGKTGTSFGDLPLHFYEQTGTGTEPIHYAVDELQRTLFVTQGQLGWGLNRIERI